ncbi:MAG: YitT family protein [Traorella sp.]
MRKTFKTIVALLIAVNLCGIGVSLFLHAQLGSDSFTLLQEGMMVSLNISIGTAALLFVLITIALALLIARKYIGWTTIVYGLIVGIFIDFYYVIFSYLNIEAMPFFIRLIWILIGQGCFILTFSLLIHYGKGMNQVDAISYALEKKTSISYKKIRTGIDILFIIIGVLFGGKFGVGSLIAMSTTGFGIDQCLRIFNRNRSYIE